MYKQRKTQAQTEVSSTTHGPGSLCDFDSSMVPGGGGKGCGKRLPQAMVNKLAQHMTDIPIPGQRQHRLVSVIDGGKNLLTPCGTWQQGEVQTCQSRMGLAGKLDTFGMHGIMGWKI